MVNRLTTVLGVRLTAEERAACDAHAEALGMTTAHWAKQILRGEAGLDTRAAPRRPSSGTTASKSKTGADR